MTRKIPKLRSRHVDPLERKRVIPGAGDAVEMPSSARTEEAAFVEPAEFKEARQAKQAPEELLDTAKVGPDLSDQPVKPMVAIPLKTFMKGSESIERFKAFDALRRTMLDIYGQVPIELEEPLKNLEALL